MIFLCKSTLDQKNRNLFLFHVHEGIHCTASNSAGRLGSHQQFTRTYKFTHQKLFIRFLTQSRTTSAQRFGYHQELATFLLNNSRSTMYEDFSTVT